MFRVPKGAHIVVADAANGCVWIDIPLALGADVEGENVITVKADAKEFLAAVEAWVDREIGTGSHKEVSHA